MFPLAVWFGSSRNLRRPAVDGMQESEHTFSVHLPAAERT